MPRPKTGDHDSYANRQFHERKRRFQRLVLLFLAYVVLALVACMSLYPLVMMIINSFKSNAEIMLNPGGWPQHWTLEDYTQLPTTQGNQLLNFFNSIVVASITTVIAVFIVGLAAYAFTKMRFPGRNTLFFFLLATIMVPGEIRLSSLFLMFSRIDWIDTYQVQIVPFIAPVFGLFMIRQYMLTIPDSFIEAARIDGGNHWRIFWHIIVPVSSPMLSAFAILHFLNMWNSYLWPQVMANDQSVAPLMVTLPSLRDPALGYVPTYGIIMAGCVLATIPILLVFLRFQDKFISGVTMGATKE
ncbi:sugar ABC transporter permease [Ktedonobacter sp. SOSP1-52]|uniref:carbohydrate ABC transporter permease n=1 Tax=Ktedonobacter sp. SOSP1-52 TaxID=2778366 RepID=UPI0019162459|nr:carbohydrate ABC transporter permease [Ktedonobacter sp. SOSP1-52]GHO61530.1 sugar ABC transporter permease [Ktedonobacter sp. SOSP1-52]